jgi:hypothetical protein
MPMIAIYVSPSGRHTETTCAGSEVSFIFFVVGGNHTTNRLKRRCATMRSWNNVRKYFDLTDQDRFGVFLSNP